MSHRVCCGHRRFQRPALHDDDCDFRERFDEFVIYVAFAILALVAATWIRVTIRRLYL